MQANNPSRLVGLSLLLLSSLLTGSYFGARRQSAPASCILSHDDFGSFQRGFSTEKILPETLFQVQQQRFTGHIEFHANNSESLILPSNATAYVGHHPSPAIDAAWDRLVEARYWSISEHEARMLWGVGFQQYRDHVKGGYTGGFDVFHMLHCLNMIRKRLDPEYYAEKHYGGMEHDMHCIDQIRQRLQCSSMATITPARYSEALGGMYVDSAQVHTCRNFDHLWEYTRQRYNGSLAVPRVQWK